MKDLMNKTKYSSEFERDYKFYLSNLDNFTFSGNPNEKHQSKIITDFDHGVSAKQSFACFDSTGKIVPTSEPELLFSVFQTKASVNWHIKQWSWMIKNYLLYPKELEETINEHQCPSWVLKAVYQQLKY